MNRPPVVTPHTPENVGHMVVSGMSFSGAHGLGAMQAYMERADEYMRQERTGVSEILAAFRSEEFCSIVARALKIAANGDSVRKMIDDAKSNENREEASRMLKSAASTAWTLVTDADQLAIEIGKLAQSGDAA